MCQEKYIKTAAASPDRSPELDSAEQTMGGILVVSSV